VSICASGHKYGLVYPGLGWAMWRSREHLPDSLMFREAYLGAEQVWRGGPPPTDGRLAA
jgi:glutamate decarboxylase